MPAALGSPGASLPRPAPASVGDPVSDSQVSVTTNTAQAWPHPPSLPQPWGPWGMEDPFPEIRCPPKWGWGMGALQG